MKPKWIPVTERYPDHSKDVLVTNGRDIAILCHEKGEWETHYWTVPSFIGGWEYENDFYPDPTHWAEITPEMLP